MVVSLAALLTPLHSAAASDDSSDGPHFLYRRGDVMDTSITMVGLRGDSVIRQSFTHPHAMDADLDGPMRFSYGGGLFTLWRAGGLPDSSLQRRLRPAAVDTAARILAVSDIHGDYDHLTSLLRQVGAVDVDLQWTWGDGRLVFVGDIFDRGEQVSECLWLLYRLQLEAARAGGRVHVLLGNHELMVLRGDLRYVNEKYTEGIVKRTGIAYNELYGPDSELGRWLRSLNTVMKINDLLIVHGGLAPWVVDSNLTMEQINDSTRAAIDVTKDALAKRPFPHRLYGTDGPFWYRGYHYGIEGKYPMATTEDVDRVLAHFDADACVIGHSEIDSLATLFGGRVVAVDVPVEKLGGFEGLLWDDGNAYRVTTSGRRVPLQLHRHSVRKSN